MRPGDAMNDEIDRRDRERKLVKMTSEEFATGFAKASAQAGQGLVNREGVLFAIALVAIVAFAIYRMIAG